MDREIFVKAVKKNVRDSAISGTIKSLINPPGRKPEQELMMLSHWYNGLNEINKEMLIKVIERAVDQSVFGFLAVVDGVRVIEDSFDKGRLDLYYMKGATQLLLNGEQDEYLHDIYKNLTSKASE